MSDLVEEIQQGGWDRYNTDWHYFEEFPEELAGLFYEVFGVGFDTAIQVCLRQDEFLGLDVIILANQLHKTEYPAQSHFIIIFCLNLEFITFVPK